MVWERREKGRKAGWKGGRSRVANWRFSMPDFYKFGTFENDLALKFSKFIYCLAFFLQKFLFTVWH